MITLRLNDREVGQEIERLIGFVREEIGGNDRAVLALSGGLDSDVVARLAVQALGSRRMKFFVVLQEDQDPRHGRVLSKSQPLSLHRALREADFLESELRRM